MRQFLTISSFLCGMLLACGAWAEDREYATVQWLPFGAVGHLKVTIERCEGPSASECVQKTAKKYTCDAVQFDRSHIKTVERVPVNHYSGPALTQLDSARCAIGPLPLQPKSSDEEYDLAAAPQSDA